MPRPLPFNNTELNDVELNARTVDVIGDLDSLNKIHFPNSDLVSAINAVPNMMNRTFYVDAVNGNDNNDGSPTAPFKTVKKAVDSVPAGGIVSISLLNDHTEQATSKIYLQGKTVIIYGYRGDGVNNNKYKLNFQIAPGGSYNTVYGFRGGGFVVFSYCDIGFVDNSDPNLPFDSAAQVIDYLAETLFSSVYLSRTKITIPDNPNINFIHSNGAGVGTVMINGYASEIVASGINSYAFRITNSTLILNSYSISVSGAKTSLSDVISGIVRDSNGVPRNIISNVVL